MNVPEFIAGIACTLAAEMIAIVSFAAVCIYKKNSKEDKNR